MKGMLVHVLRPADGSDCTNGGISSKYTEFIVVGDGVPELFEPSEKTPALLLVRNRTYWACVRPLNLTAEQRLRCGPMFGGNFVHTSDGRFNNGNPVAIHDRFE